MATFFSNGQNSNPLFIEGSVSYNKGNSSNYYTSSPENFSILPTVGFFATEKFAIGGGIYYVQNNIIHYFMGLWGDYLVTVAIREFGVSLLGRYHENITEKLSWGGSVRLLLGKAGAYGLENNDGYFYGIIDTKYNNYSIRGSISPEIIYDYKYGWNFSAM